MNNVVLTPNYLIVLICQNNHKFILTFFDLNKYKIKPALWAIL